jgi:hypothetical protein
MNISEYAPFGEKFCEGRCEWSITETPTGPVRICDGCMRIVKEGRPEKIEELKRKIKNK